jgi:hypothetical protein
MSVFIVAVFVKAQLTGVNYIPNQKNVTNKGVTCQFVPLRDQQFSVKKTTKLPPLGPYIFGSPDGSSGLDWNTVWATAC